MRRALKLLPLLLLFSWLLAGSVAAQQSVLERDMEEMKRRLALNEQAVAAMRNQLGGEGNAQTDALMRGQADLKADLDAVRAEGMTLSGRFDDLNNTLEAQRLQLEQLREELQFKVKALEERLAKLEEAPAKAVTPPAAELAPEALYQQGLDAIRTGSDFARGRQVLGEFVAKYPKHPLAVNAKYWIGEAWYGEKKYENAILQFQDVIQEFGDHPKVAAALLKQALSFQALGNQENTRVILQKVVERFPLSEEAQKAKKLLAE